MYLTKRELSLCIRKTSKTFDRNELIRNYIGPMLLKETSAIMCAAVSHAQTKMYMRTGAR